MHFNKFQIMVMTQKSYQSLLKYLMSIGLNIKISGGRIIGITYKITIYIREYYNKIKLKLEVPSESEDHTPTTGYSPTYHINTNEKDKDDLTFIKRNDISASNKTDDYDGILIVLNIIKLFSIIKD